MSLIDAVTSHQAGKAMRSLSVPEWGCVVHCQPLTLEQRSAIHRQAREGGLGYQAHAVCNLALDAEGKRLFAPTDLPRLLHKADPFVIERIAYFLLGPDYNDLDPNEEVDRLGESSGPATGPKISPG